MKTIGELQSDSTSAYDYVVNDSVGRLALTGMSIGDTIFQRDEGQTYVADSAVTSVLKEVDLTSYSSYTYVVADDTARLALTGMTVGDTIFVTETGSVYTADSPTTSITNTISKASDLEVSAGVEDTKFITSKQVMDNYGEISPGNTNTYLEANTERATLNASYTTLKQFTINKDGNFEVNFDMKTENAAQVVFAQIFINTVAIGTEHNTTSTSYLTKTQNFKLNIGDVVELKGRSNTIWNAFVRNFNIKYDLISGVTAGVVDID